MGHPNCILVILVQNIRLLLDIFLNFKMNFRFFDDKTSQSQGKSCQISLCFTEAFAEERSTEICFLQNLKLYRTCTDVRSQAGQALNSVQRNREIRSFVLIIIQHSLGKTFHLMTSVMNTNTSINTNLEQISKIPNGYYVYQAE